MNQVICDHAGTCRLSKTCRHQVPHEPIAHCEDQPCPWDIKAYCIPVEPEGDSLDAVTATAMPTFDEAPKEPDYKAMWERLKDEIANLQAEGVDSIDIVLLRRFTCYIEGWVKGWLK